MKLPSFPHTIKKGNSIIKIYRHDNGGYDEFKVAYYQTGKRKMETFADFEDARKRADEINDSVNTGNAHTLTLTGEDRHAFTRAMEALKPLNVPLEIAVLQFAEAFKTLDGVSVIEAARYYAKKHPSKLPNKSVEVVVDEFIKSKTARKLSKRYIEDLNYRLGKFKKAFHVDIAQLDSITLKGFMDKLDLAPRSYNNFRTTLISFFEFAKRQKYLPLDWNEFEAIEDISDKGGAIEIFTPQELADLLTHADDRLIPFLTIGAFAGLRSAEIDRLQWKDVKFSTGYIVVEAANAKTATRRIVPISDNLKAWLQPYAKKKGGVWPHAHAYLYEMLQSATTAAKVPWKQNALRHSYISYRVADTQEVNKTALEAGNSPAMIFSNYRELVTPQDAKSWFSLKADETGKEITFLKAA